MRGAARTLIIAEAGVNHNGQLDLALGLVDAAAAAGADIVKFQSFRADRIATDRAEKAAYQQRQAPLESQREMLRRLELSREAHEAIAARCVMRGIEFLSTGFDVPSLDLLSSMGVTLFKIPSGEITNLPYLRHVGAMKGEVILSTGMATLDDIDAAIGALEAAGTPRHRITLLQCTTQYPAPFQDVNLRAIPAMRERFGVPVGFSDHTAGLEAAIAAVALGATVVEKHFTLDRSLPGPDHAASLEPPELSAMVLAIRNVEAALGDGHKRPMPSEQANLDAARKSLVAAVPIRAGERFTLGNLTAKRPGGGLSPMRLDDIVGRVASRDFDEDEWIEL
jgi:N,N'-diacetyllegionaminate synthase